MQPTKFIAATGSHRPAERGDDPAEKERFEKISEAIGEALYYQGVNLRVIWSNDHVEDQCSPLDKNAVTLRPDGLRETPPENAKYLFEATADYHVMEGFLKAAQKDPSLGGKVELLISKQMWTGDEREPGSYAWPPVAGKTIGDKTLGALVENGLVIHKPISDTITRDGETRKHLRSLQVSDVVSDFSPLGAPVDNMLVIGGGKATQVAVTAGFNQGSIIPIPYCGAEGLSVLKQYFAAAENMQLISRKYPALREPTGKVTSAFTPPSETGVEYTTMSVEAVKAELPRILTEFLASPDDLHWQPSKKPATDYRK